MEAEIHEVFLKWAKAIQSRSVENVLKLYHHDALLWGTLAKETRHGHERISAYFVKFLERDDLKCEFKESKIRIYNEFAFISGSYEFSWRVADKSIIIPARFSFVYKKENDQWLILEHHSSLYPDHEFKMKNFIIQDT